MRISQPERRSHSSVVRIFRLGLAWVGRYELATLVLVGIVAAGTWGFVELADEVTEGDSADVDRSLLLVLRTANDVSDPIGPSWFEEAARDVTALGGVAILLAVTLAAGGFVLLQRQSWTAVFLFAAVAGGTLVSFVLKEAFDRPRPDLVPHATAVYTRSFPSGHSAMSAVTWLTLAALLARVQRRRQLKAYLLGIAIAVTIAVGFSRVYLGVHWPTDVLAGWTIGAVWASASWLVFRWCQRQTSSDERL